MATGNPYGARDNPVYWLQFFWKLTWIIRPMIQIVGLRAPFKTFVLWCEWIHEVACLPLLSPMLCGR